MSLYHIAYVKSTLVNSFVLDTGSTLQEAPLHYLTFGSICPTGGIYGAYDGLEALGDNALYGNPVPALVLPDSLRGRLSLWLENVRTLDIPRGVSELHLSLNKVETLTIPQGVYSVELCLPKARHLVIPEGVEHVIVTNSPLLERLDLPNSLRGTVSFDHCDSLKRLRIPEGVTTLRNDCFRECHALERVELPASLTTIETCAFIHETGSKVKAVVAAPEGSYALKFAREEGLNWEALQGQET